MCLNTTRSLSIYNSSAIVRAVPKKCMFEMKRDDSHIFASKVRNPDIFVLVAMSYFIELPSAWPQEDTLSICDFISLDETLTKFYA